MELAEASATNSDSAGGDSLTDEPSVTSSLGHLVAGSQGVITKRIDLALLEGRELLSRSIERAALVGAGMVLAAAAWFAGAPASFCSQPRMPAWSYAWPPSGCSMEQVRSGSSLWRCDAVGRRHGRGRTAMGQHYSVNRYQARERTDRGKD